MQVFDKYWVFQMTEAPYNLSLQRTQYCYAPSPRSVTAQQWAAELRRWAAVTGSSDALCHLMKERTRENGRS